MQLSEQKVHEIDGSGLKIAIVLPYFNEKIGLQLLEGAKNKLLASKVKESNIEVVRVAGALEIPLKCQQLTSKKPDAIIALGVIIRGETSHYELVTETTFNGLMEVQLKTGIAISFGILTCENKQQALRRADENGLNKGGQAAEAALLQIGTSSGGDGTKQN